MKNIYNSVAELVGKTPMVRLSRLAKKHKVKAHLLAKCEFLNPLGSVKDRVALKMIEKAEENKFGVDRDNRGNDKRAESAGIHRHL